LDGYLPFETESRRPGGPATAVRVERDAGPGGLPAVLAVLAASAGLLAAVVRVTPPEARAYHPAGSADPAGFAAMAVVDTLVHTHDVLAGLGLGWEPPAELCARVLGRLFPNAPRDTPPWATLLWATGRGVLPGRERLRSWRWYADVRE
jgi:hypothetical protein